MSTPFLRNAWYCAALADEVGRQPLGRIYLNDPVVLYRLQDGTAVAFEDTCPHRRAPLHQGCLEGDNIQCPYHGIKFDRTGIAVWAQGQEKLPPAMCLRSYPLVERQGWLWIWMGDPALADPGTIFDCWSCDDPQWAVIKGLMHVDASAMLAVDNLMDLSHTAFVHAASMGSADDINPDALTWTITGDTIRGKRVALDIAPAPQQVASGADCRIDLTKEMAFTPPYNCNVDIYSTETGVERRKGRFTEEFLTYNLLTPETDKSHHYFWAHTRNMRLDDQAFHEMFTGLAIKLLNEDKRILELTQRATDLNPTRPEVDLVADAGGLRARRVLKRLIDEEQATVTRIKVAA